MKRGSLALCEDTACPKFFDEDADCQQELGRCDAQEVKDKAPSLERADFWNDLELERRQGN